MYHLHALLISALSVGANSIAIRAEVARDNQAWSLLGCYVDNVSGRALPNGVSVPGGSGALTNAACQAVCLTAGFHIAGTEYSGECCKCFSLPIRLISFQLILSGCGNTIENGGGAAPDGNAQCNMKCNGDSMEICGGPNRLTVYQHTNTSPGTSPSTGKRGLCYNNNNPSANAIYANLFKGYNKVSWGYNWGFPSYDLDPLFEFVRITFSTVYIQRNSDG